MVEDKRQKVKLNSREKKEIKKKEEKRKGNKRKTEEEKEETSYLGSCKSRHLTEAI